MKILKNYFGKTANNKDVLEYTLTNDNSAFIKVLNYGGIISEICVPDKYDNFENVVLSLDNIENYEEKSPCFGALIGRIAGRVSNASFTIDDVEYKLKANNFNSNLHGGPFGFNNQIWNIKEVIDKDYVALELSYLSSDGDQGFPGNLNVKAVYKFTNDNILEISYEAETDKKTIITLTNHSYFNLSGNCKEKILNHSLTINSDEYILINSEGVPESSSDVKNTPFDFRQCKNINKDIFADNEQIKYGNGYDHPFILNQTTNPQVILEEEKSGRILEISTDQPIVVLFTANSIRKDMTLRGGVSSDNHLGVCLETQWYPDAINNPNFPAYILNPGEKYNTKTTYAFKVKY
ncbi:aldose epimerase family protein [Clostridium ganghwense]|uniref:Aldose 1-epimerase n=1 Tax=Clostridium ganghwense TaxID=312089 RepID=A0ABT4CMI7_9CLOT|nr:aldose epimerase family protein [Clostridium ganghwense]MCY6369301.1 galactose mutarotase [Clostridium ganghwense]